jgi:tetratricopeptide (TPR) repeat protein
MKLLIKTAMIVALLVMLAFSLWHDLVQLARRQGDDRLRANDPSAAEIAFRRAVMLGGDDVSLAYNLGVAFYRKGDFVEARQQFSAALSRASPELAAAIHYNMGNCQYRLAEQRAAHSPDAARHFLQGAVADYGQTLALRPDSVDAGDNLELARGKLMILGGGDQNNTADAAAGKEKGDGRAGNSRNGSAAARGTAESNKALARSTATKVDEQGSAREADDAEQDSAGGNRRAELSRGEAERLLNEARGRERPSGIPHGGGRIAHSAVPERNW